MPLSLIRPHKNILALLPPNPVCKLHLRSHRLHPLLFYTQFVREVLKSTCPELICKGPLPIKLKVKRWTVLRSPFKYKKAQETFERRLYQRSLVLYNISIPTLDACLHYITSMAPPNQFIDFHIQRFEHFSRDQFEQEMKVQSNESLVNLVQPPRSKLPPWTEQVYYQELANQVYEKYQRGDL